MKIKEVVVEGIWDTIKGYAKSGSAGAKAAQAQARGQKDLNLFLDKVFQKWNEYTASTGDKDIVNWTKRFFKTDKINYMPGAEDPASQRNFLQKALQDYKRGAFTQVPLDKETKTQGGAPAGIPGFTVVNTDPIMIRYRKNDYALNSQGEWYPMGKGSRAPLVKDSDPTLEKLLDKVANFKS